MGARDSFEGDLIRPLGLVTLNFGYVEAAVNELGKSLGTVGSAIDLPQSAPLGQKLEALSIAVRAFIGDGAIEVAKVLESAKPFLERRNSLVHASVLAGGLVKPNDTTKSEWRVSPEELNALANDLFDWKERLSVAAQKWLLPGLRLKASSGT